MITFDESKAVQDGRLHMQNTTQVMDSGIGVYRDELERLVGNSYVRMHPMY